MFLLYGKIILLLTILFKLSLLQKYNDGDDRVIKAITNFINLVEFSFDYKKRYIFIFEKYNITFSNIRLLSPLESDIKVIKKDEKYILNSITFTFVFDIKIELGNKKSIYDTDRLIEYTFKEISFQKKEDDFLLNLDDFNNYTFFYSKSKMINKLVYFNEFNNGFSCLVNFNENNNIIHGESNEIRNKIFTRLIKERFITLNNSVGLKGYDFLQILEKLNKKIIVKEETYIRTKILSLTITKVDVNFDQFQLQKENLAIYPEGLSLTAEFEKSQDKVNCILSVGTFLIVSRNGAEFSSPEFLINVSDSNDSLSIIITETLVPFIRKIIKDYYSTIPLE